MLLVRSGCGRNNIAETGVELPFCSSKLRITAQTLAKMSILLCNQQKVKRLSGGLHSAVLFDRLAQVVAGYEDVGRHNAMDKAIGHAMLHNIRLDDKILFTTGRTSYEMVTKAARVGIPVLVSLSSPTSLSVEYAQNCGITLVGYVRQSKMIVYSCPERIDFATIDHKDYEERHSLAN
jgi:FdhD protein